MSTNGLDSWAVYLGEIWAVYPFQGFEVFMVLAAVAFWIGFHVMQAKVEARELEQSEADFDKARASKSIDRY